MFLSELKTFSVKTVISMQPARKSSIEPKGIEPPVNMRTIELTRVYRCTQAIGRFLSFALIQWTGFDRYLCFDLKIVKPGHEILGVIPECLCLRICDRPGGEVNDVVSSF